MFDVPRSALSALRHYLEDLDPARVTTGQAATLFDLFARLERLGAAGKLLVAPRAAESDVWVRQGHRTPASWMAELTGCGMGEASGVLDVAERLERLPATVGALRRGELSTGQAKEITSAASRVPSAEKELLEAAAADSMRQLRDRCRKVKAAAASSESAAAREQRIHRTRFLRTWSDEEGAFRLEARLTPEAGARMLAGLHREADAAYEEARLAGRREGPCAYLADALVRLTTGQHSDSGGRPRPPAQVQLRVDLAALRRGELEAGEICEIPGVGPVALATAERLIGDSFVKILVTDGVDVQCVAHIGRSIPAHMMTALAERDPTCVVPGCAVAQGLEVDHYQVPFASGGPSELWNLARLCSHHHRQKTHGGHELVGGPGHWVFRRSRAGPASEDDDVPAFDVAVGVGA